MKTLDEITIPAVNIPEHVLPVVPEDVLPSFEEMNTMWNQVLKESGIADRTQSFYERVADDIKDTLSIRGYDVSGIEDTNFYVKFDSEDKPESFEETMNTAFP